MSSDTRVQRFTQKWQDLFQWFEDNPQAHKRVPCENLTEARKVRFEFYQVRNAIACNTQLSAQFTNIQKRRVILDGTALVFQPAEASDTAVILDRALRDTQ